MLTLQKNGLSYLSLQRVITTVNFLQFDLKEKSGRHLIYCVTIYYNYHV